MSKYHYLIISLEFIHPSECEISPTFLKKNIVEAVNQLFGEVSAAVNIDILKFNSNNNSAVIRIPSSHYVKVRSSLTLACKFEGQLCRYTVHKATSLLLSIQAESRDYKH